MAAAAAEGREGVREGGRELEVGGCLSAVMWLS